MSKLKNVIKILIIISVILLVTIIIVLNKSKKSNISTVNNIESNVSESKEEIELSYREYFLINNCIKKYLDSINVEKSSYYGFDENRNYVKTIDEEEIKKGIYNLLSRNFINQNNITTDNIYEKIDTVEELLIFATLNIQKIYDGTVKTYYVKGVTEHIETYQIERELELIVNIDDINKTFSIEMAKDNKNRKELSKIEKNENNLIDDIEISENDIVKEYVDLYKKIAIGNTKWFYDNILDKEYREKKFPNFEDFKDFVNDNKSQIIGCKATAYNKENKEGYIQYVISDQFNNTYLIKEKNLASGNYSMYLDNYTINSDETAEKYNSMTTRGKVAINIQKFIKAINDKDYNFAYNCLSSEFKNNYFKDIESFEQYVKENFYENNSVELIKYTEINSLYTYEIELRGENTNNDDEDVITKTFVMKLNEGTDFEMSFDV